MNIKRLAGIVILIFAFIAGCSGSYGRIKTHSKADSKATLKELEGNGSDYHIWYKSTVMIFDLI